MDRDFIPPWRELSPRRVPVRRAYTAMDLYRECEARRFEEMQIPLGTDRVMNDLLRLQHQMRASDDDQDSRIEDLERDQNETSNTIRELESRLDDAD